MDIWYDNFLWIFIFMLAAGWYIPKLFWYSNYNISKKVFICFLFSIMSMVFAAGILALLTFCLEYGIYVMANAFFKDVSSSLILYFEVGGETTAGWFIAIILRIIVLIRNDAK